MNKLTCLLPVEIKSRDLDPKLLLGTELVSNGFNVVIGAKSAVNKIMGQFSPFLYFDKGLSPDVKFYESIHNKDGRVAVLDEEGGVFENSMFTFLIRYPEHILPYVDLVFCWGQKTRNCLLENRKNIDKNKLHITGHPRFDLKLKKYEALFAEKASMIRSTYKDFVLVNTSFAYANHFVGYNVIKASGGYCGKEDALKEGVDYAYYRLLIYYFIKAIKRVSRTYPNINIVLRPHPSESSELYAKHLNGLRNVFIKYEGNVQEWILASRVVLHHDCTTGIEAVLSGKPTISYTPIRDNDFAPSLPMMVSKEVSTEDSLIEKIGYYLNQDKLSEPTITAFDRAILSNWLAFGDGGAAAEIARIIKDKECDIITRIETAHKCEVLFKNKIKRVLSYVVQSRKNDAYIKHKNVLKFDEEKLQKRIDSIVQISSHPRMTVMKVDDACYSLRSLT